ncbi:ABC transporter, ATP-binding protein [Endomicrobium proavitum]|uniref:ABC transporter, ATP-binding protein n=1 Tax=Endomicrobium proavitum TaxID=1408281 RepID=A0A0G3WIU5_9BACT|nr:ABC-F family ATP-binding cassette domain-containing protein [Endomicrobium proavitum]AKL97797.1 ABC transporter, ATP-binding protein [Endomicrobium proavitum]
MIKITDLNKSFGGRILFDNLSLNINAKERVGLVGRNGHGKTTLFKIILGEMDYDSGSINIPKNYKIGYLQQHIKFTKPTAVEEACLALPVGEKDETWKAEKILSGLGFSSSDMHKNPLEFSGGYKIRINLAKVLLSNANMLMLDEPNNYLDIVAIRWLSQFLRSWKGELILITHDRNFMDSCITHCACIHRTKARKVEGSTQKLYEQIDKEEEIYEKTRLNAEKKRKQTEIFISRFRAKARLAGMVQSRIKSLEKQDSMEGLTELEDLDFSFSSLPFNAAKMMGVHNLKFGYTKDNPLIQNLSFDVLKKERICVIGKNGKGKSTLLKLIADRLEPSDGSIKKHPDLKTAYFVQSDAADLNPLKTVFEEILSTDGKCLPQKARNIAGSMMFSGNDALKKIDILSGGEKSRVLLGKILVNPCHMLLLDEPTNHLDMESCEGLIDAINEFNGSVILVTHNEELLYNIAEKLIIFDRDKVSVFEGTYKDFLETRGWEDESGDIKNKNAKREKVFSKEELKKQRAHLIQEKSRILKPLEESIVKLEKEITAKEKELNENTQKLIQASMDQDVTFLVDGAKIDKQLKSELETLYLKLGDMSVEFENKNEHFRLKMMEID